MRRVRPRSDSATSSKLLLTALFVCCAVANAAAQQTEAWTLATTLRYHNVSAPVISPDGSRAAVIITTPRFNADSARWQSALHVFPVGAASNARPLFSIDDATAPQWSPDGRWLAFASSRSGARNVWRVPAGGGAAEALTSLTRSIGEFRFSPDGRALAFAVSDTPRSGRVRAVGEDHRFARLYVTALDGGERNVRLLTTANMQVGGHVGAGLDGPGFSWSPDGAAIAFTHSPSPLGDDWVNADVSIVDVVTAAVRPLVRSPSAEGGLLWSPDGKWIAMAVSDAPATYALTTRIHLVSPTTGEHRMLAESWDRRPSLVGWTADSKRVVISEGRGVGTRVSLLPADGSARVDLSPDSMLLGGVNLGARGTMVGFTSESAQRPPEAYVATLSPFRSTRLTHAQPADVPAPPRTEVVRWRSDNLEVEGLLTYPIGWREGTRVPLLVIVHGGPPSAFTNSFTGRFATYPIAVFAQRGFAVLRPNVRGSSGYGRDFRYANTRDWGGGDYRDMMAGVDALVARGIADSARVGLMGWSYGGYLTAISITRTTRFRAASVGAGITDLVSYSGTADIPGFVPSYYGGKDFWDDADAYRRGSAIANVSNVTTPTLIQHGDQDERVPIGQGYQLFYALKRRGVPVRMLVYPRQGHGISDLNLQLEAARANVEWFEKWLK